MPTLQELLQTADSYKQKISSAYETPCRSDTLLTFHAAPYRAGSYGTQASG